MKNQIFILSAILFFAISSCKDDEDDEAFAKITVTENGQAKSGVTVYVFRKSKGPNTSFYKPFFADITVVTESDGVATFNLEKELSLVDTQNTFYFGVFNVRNAVLGQTALTIEKGQTKSATISY